jgi:hypothetical protein
MHCQEKVLAISSLLAIIEKRVTSMPALLATGGLGRHAMCLYVYVLENLADGLDERLTSILPLNVHFCPLEAVIDLAGRWSLALRASPEYLAGLCQWHQKLGAKGAGEHWPNGSERRGQYG